MQRFLENLHNCFHKLFLLSSLCQPQSKFSWLKRVINLTACLQVVVILVVPRLIENAGFFNSKFKIYVNFTVLLRENCCITEQIPSSNNFKGELSGLRQLLATEYPLKMTKNAFYFILKALFILKIFTFLSWLFGHVEKLDVTIWFTKNCNTYIDQYLKK